MVDAIRYTVFSLEMDDADTDEHVSGLTAEQAAMLLIERSGYRPAAEPGTEAWASLCAQIVSGEVLLPGPYIAVPDEEYRRNRAASLPEGAAKLLSRLEDGYWHILTDRDDQRIADELAAAGITQKKKQARRGFPPMYRIGPQEDA